MFKIDELNNVLVFKNGKKISINSHIFGSDGVNSEIRKFIDKKITIPSYTKSLGHDYKELHIMPTKDGDFKLEPNHQLFRQMTRITRDKGALRHDDQIDALAIAANAWVERMDRDQVLSYNQHKEELLDRELERFMESTIGRTPHKDSWI